MTATLFDLTPRITLRDRVDAALLAAGRYGATDWELTVALGESERRKPSICKRRGELAAEALTVGGETVTRMSPDGSPCTVWVHPAVAVQVARSLHPSTVTA